ncbi:LysR family transcriptional regulator [Comamonas endophytica]|uniref:LysR family transcriptional regulator n=1 Tax=Comamonas endophytica TaxID=2949090 RepID=A0ABY6GEJ7_9BURK|nr:MULTISPECIES: LysR family transcriptional regulator [unclassified Acidovorax]MCD2513247.1 LysR family transcriptional regulator [Acidovorax sp. D4N7]UYG53409.1 LysR family transcriptional regulator [Acidovorax sp. 5MLIR]
MDLRTLRYFIAVLEAGSLSRAAGSLYVAQPALTAQIKKLEAELGAQLLERSHAGVTPTPAGMQLYEDARRLLSDADALRERIQRLPQGPEGSVTVAAPFLLASLLLGPVLAGLRRSHPRIRVFVLDDLSLMVRKAMLERRADIGILVDTPQLENLRCRPLARESIFICGHDVDGTVAPLLRRLAAGGYPEIDFVRAAQLPLVLQSRRFSIRQAVEETASRQGVGLNVVHEHDSARVIRSLYQCGAGFTFTPACSLAESTHQGRKDWIVARVARPALQRAYTLATSAERLNDAATQVVADALAQETARLVRAGIWQAELLS